MEFINKEIGMGSIEQMKEKEFSSRYENENEEDEFEENEMNRWDSVNLSKYIFLNFIKVKNVYIVAFHD